jgi:hypothetical protein
MAKAQSAVLTRSEEQARPPLSLPASEEPAPLPPRREPRTAERIRDALLQWLEEEA